MTIAADLAAITPTAPHIASVQAQGISPAMFLGVLTQKLSDLIESNVQFQNTLPAGDANAESVAALISALS
jgi:hypothetical protein